MNLTLLDGPMGTELNARGVPTDLPLWSAVAIERAPDVIADIHRAYRLAGASVHTANTFRTKRRTAGDDWERLTREAVAIARRSVQSQRVAGSIAPLEDCYRPELSPPEPRDEHEQMAWVLSEAGCDLLLCETFPHVGEATVAVEAAVATGKETWIAFTAGPHADLLTPQQIGAGARLAVSLGVSGVLVNCIPAAQTLRFVVELESAQLGVPFGAYANAGREIDRLGWGTESRSAARGYLHHVRQWIDAGATLVGGCCGTGPAHIAAIAEFANLR